MKTKRGQHGVAARDLLESKSKRWFREDRCFASLFHRAYEHTNSDLKADTFELLKQHEDECGRCLWNVRTVAETDGDQDRRRVYLRTFRRALVAWVRINGGTHEVETKPDGTYVRTVLPSRLDLPQEPPFTSMEHFKPSDRSQPGYVTFDVRSQELFNDPRPLVQHLDATTSRDVRFLPPGDLHWRMIIGEGNCRLRIRWQGQVKELEADWGLHARYQALIRKSSQQDPWLQRDRGMPKPEHSDGEEILKLRKAARDYKGSSWFMGYFKETTNFRRIDAHRAAGRRPLDAAQSLDHDDAPIDLRQCVAQPEGTARLDLRLLLECVMPNLTERQRQVLQLKAQDLTDAEIGRRLGVARETVNRDWSRIRQIAQRHK